MPYRELRGKKILLIEDDAHVCSFIYKGLSEAGLEVNVAMSGEQGLQAAQVTRNDLIILDIMLPTINGLDVCRQIRESDSQIPVLFLTALGTSENIVLGLDTGADDYLVKPFKFIELLARIRTLLRRSEHIDHLRKNAEMFFFEGLEINDETKTVKRKDIEISLTSTEYRLLLMFIKNPKKVFSRTELLEEVWGINFDIDTNVVDVYINYLRKKLEKNNMPRLIQTVVGMGYVLK